MASPTDSTPIPSQVIPRAFPGIKPDEVEELIRSGQINQYSTDKVLCHENALEDTFYLILNGQVQVTKVINNIQDRLLKTLGPGDFFGEMALIHNAPRAATVKSVTPLVVLEINKEAFDRVLKHSSSVALALVKEISRRLRENDEMAIEDLRLRARELAEAYQKLAEQDLARRDFLTNIAHQLRTPLMAANGFLQMVQAGMIPPSEMAAALATVSRNVQQIATLVNDILFIQEMDLILEKFQPVDAVKLITTVVDHYQDKAKEKGIKLRLRSPAALPPISGDPRHLERAFTSLVDNAVKFSPEGGAVEVTLAQEGDRLAISVQDEGIGISPEALPRIFDRFYHQDKSGERLFEGLGLGLAIARQVIEQHKGRIDVVSTPGRGSSFTVKLNIWKDSEATIQLSRKGINPV
jgi:signal transduction histidine kinase